MSTLALSRGVPVKIINALASSATGAADPEFCVPSIPGGIAKVRFSASGPSGVIVALNGNIEATQDDGTTWDVFQAFDFAATPILNIEVPPGIRYRFNFTTVTTGPYDVYGSLR